MPSRERDTRDFSRMLEGYLPDAESVNTKESFSAKARISRDLPIQARLDLHGQTLEEARKSVDRFLKDSANRGFRKVLIIHGKGSGILKTGIARYLEGHPLAGKREFAEREEGGSGALLLYLKG